MKVAKKKQPKKPIPKTTLIDRLFPAPPKAKNPSCYQMLVMENRLKNIVTPKPINTYTDKQLLELFHIKLVSVDDKEIPKSAQTILEPISDVKYNAILTVRRNDAHMVNALICDVATFLLNMAEDGKIKEQIVREKKEKVTTYTLKRDFLARTILMPRSEIENAVLCYDKSKPKMDEIRFVSDLAKKYRTTTDMVVRRIRDIRRLRTTAGYADCNSAIKRLDFLSETKEMQEVPVVNKFKRNKNTTV